MGKYIPKDALVAEIKRLIKHSEMVADHNTQITELVSRELDALYHLISFLDTLEVKEEILDKEGKTNLMQKCVREAYKRGYDMGVLQTTNKINHNMKEVDLD